MTKQNGNIYLLRFVGLIGADKIVTIIIKNNSNNDDDFIAAFIALRNQNNRKNTTISNGSIVKIVNV